MEASFEQAQQTPLIRISPETYPVLDRWMSLGSGEFRTQLDQLAALAADPQQPASVQRSIHVAKEALAVLYRRRFDVIATGTTMDQQEQRR